MADPKPDLAAEYAGRLVDDLAFAAPELWASKAKVRMEQLLEAAEDAVRPYWADTGEPLSDDDLNRAYASVGLPPADAAAPLDVELLIAKANEAEPTNPEWAKGVWFALGWIGIGRPRHAALAKGDDDVHAKALTAQADVFG